MLILTRKLFEIVVVNGSTLITYLGYCASTTVHTFSIAESNDTAGRLVTLRPTDETVIDGDIVMKVLHRKSSGSCRLGFEAPLGIVIDRLEIHQQRNRAKP